MKPRHVEIQEHAIGTADHGSPAVTAVADVAQPAIGSLAEARGGPRDPQNLNRKVGPSPGSKSPIGSGESSPAPFIPRGTATENRTHDYARFEDSSTSSETSASSSLPRSHPSTPTTPYPHCRDCSAPPNRAGGSPGRDAPKENVGSCENKNRRSLQKCPFKSMQATCSSRRSSGSPVPSHSSTSPKPGTCRHSPHRPASRPV